MAAKEDTAGAGAGAGAGDEIKPYKIRVSSRYLKLTKQKLELTRLPHEGAEPKSTDWWEPKAQVEPLVDFWLEKYSWRDQEAALNSTPQFRTAVSIPGSDQTALRLHFVHVRSPHAHAHALPLLLIPPFPLVNLALVHLVKLFTEPEDAAAHDHRRRAFHLVIPALPGLGFSDPFPTNTPEIATSAEMLNTLMLRLGYERYLVSNAGAAQSSPAEIDWKLVERLATQYPQTCAGAHFIAPPLAAPKLSEAPLEWAKWRIAHALNSGILGYSAQDFSALKQTTTTTMASKSAKKGLTPRKLGLNQVGLREPNTLAYAMCDSPTGLLVFAMKGLGLLAPRMQFTPTQLITFTNLAWLPGPEYAMRFWAHCAANDESQEKERKPSVNKPKVGITVFLGGNDQEQVDETTVQEVGEGAIRLDLETPLKTEAVTGYACPAWAKTHYNVLFSQRISGQPGLLAWERPEVILAGIRGLANEVVKTDQHLWPPSSADILPATEPLESVVVEEQTATVDGGLKPPIRPALTQDGSSRTRVGSPEGGLKPPERPTLEQGDSSQTQVGSQPPSSPKGKEPEMAPAPAVEEAAKPQDGNETDQPSPDTPDTVVLVTAPTDEKLTKP
ncbi:unnamed protein product [Discula destructiva]